jgi:O-succinylbenzoic acid--CoA ligase
MNAITCPIFAGAQRHPQAAALVTPQRTWSYRELDAAIANAATQFRRTGLRRGEKLAVHLPNDWRYPVVLFALLRLGVFTILTNLRLPPAAIAAQLRTAGVRRILAAGKLKLPGIQQLDLDLGGWGFQSREGVLRAGAGLAGLESPAHQITGLGWSSSVGGAFQPRDMSKFHYTSPRRVQIPLNEPAVVLFTSASSGAAKAVVLTFGNLYCNALGSNRNIVLRRGDRWQLSLPLYHVSGLGVLLRAWLAGAAVVIPASDDALEPATHVSLVPTQLRRLLAAPQGVPWLQGLKAVLVGGAATDARLLATARSAGIRVLPTYGMTELASQVCTLPPDALRSKWFTSGRVLPFREMKLANSGEIMVRGRTRFFGYLVHGRLQRLAPACWFGTGDLGAVDADGYLTVLGRKDDMFISGGENIQPAEIEQVLLALPGVAAAVVVPRADPEFGARPVAFVRLARRVSEEKLRGLLRRNLPAYKVPVEFLPWPEAVPMTLKINRPFFAAQLLKLDAQRPQ